MDKNSDFHVRVEQGGVVTHWTANDTTLSMVKRKATRLKADLVEITDSNGVTWTREIMDTRWRMGVPTRPSPTTLPEILARMSLLRAEHQELNTRLDAFRVQCPTCCCKLIPGQACQCCAGREVFRRLLGMSPAGMVADAADYRFCSYGAWVLSGRHPFATAFAQCLRPSLPDPLCRLSPQKLLQALRKEFARLSATKARATDAETEAAMLAAGREPPFTLCARRRVRYWTDGLVIGSSLFVRDLMRRYVKPDLAERHRLAQAMRGSGGDVEICSWRRLRVVQT